MVVYMQNFLTPENNLWYPPGRKLSKPWSQYGYDEAQKNHAVARKSIASLALR
jgi:hypothetical protein